MTTSTWALRVPHEDRKAAYEHLRAAHLNAVRASLEDHVAALEWPHQRIEHYQTERLRSLLAFAVADARRTHLVGYASVIGHLARAAIAGELDVRPVRVSTKSEPLSEEDRDAMEVALGHARPQPLGLDRDWRPGSRLRPRRWSSHLRR
jgi:hypothetical protein